jgi:hypothetical protein
MFRNCLRVTAVVVFTMALGTVAAASADPVRTHQLQTVVADGYYNPNGNNVTWPIGPSL